ncbi:DUF523 domain-containing protein [Staphylococcus ratti]|uniref:DUF523 domain-containing protein n=1 Tax=Staphylococcus ratti TaxID=2892440 RepID=A0ABY3PCR2_9STAP|nr:DUF523 domain-containing protein [Staphylococcus ratti]UEX90044.1 DUF523 domain-containing protein [Staphylococcus ratti]
MILISACLAGENVRYDGGNTFNLELKKLVDSGLAQTICPEILGGLSIPREPVEIVGGDGHDVLNHKAKIIDIKGNDVTQDYLKGAALALKTCKALNCTTLILKSNSPTCGSTTIYSGEFNGNKKSGVGLFTAMLARHNIKVYDENNFPISSITLNE